MNQIAIVTFLSVLLQMRKELGLEAMLQYMENYQKIAIKENTNLNRAITCALEITDVKRIFEALKENQ
jgi:hypothetical protein